MQAADTPLAATCREPGAAPALPGIHQEPSQQQEQQQQRQQQQQQQQQPGGLAQVAVDCPGVGATGGGNAEPNARTRVQQTPAATQPGEGRASHPGRRCAVAAGPSRTCLAAPSQGGAGPAHGPAATTLVQGGGGSSGSEAAGRGQEDQGARGDTGRDEPLLAMAEEVLRKSEMHGRCDQPQ